MTLKYAELHPEAEAFEAPRVEGNPVSPKGREAVDWADEEQVDVSAEGSRSDDAEMHEVHEKNEDVHSYRRRMRSKFMGSHTCRALLLGVLLLGAVSLKKFNAGRAADRSKSVQKEHMKQYRGADQFNGRTRPVGHLQASRNGLDIRGLHARQQFAADFAAAMARAQAHKGDPGPGGDLGYSGSNGFAHQQSGALSFEQQQRFGRVPSTPPRIGGMLFGIAVGTLLVWFFLVRGIRQLRQWLAGSHWRRNSGKSARDIANDHDAAEDDEETPLTKGDDS